MASDNTSVEYWIFTLGGRLPHGVDLAPVRMATEAHVGNQTLGISVLGWHSAADRRLVVEVRDNEYQILGYWTVHEDGSSPRSLGADERQVRVKRFGRVVDSRSR